MMGDTPTFTLLQCFFDVHLLWALLWPAVRSVQPHEHAAFCNQLRVRSLFFG